MDVSALNEGKNLESRALQDIECPIAEVRDTVGSVVLVRAAAIPFSSCIGYPANVVLSRQRGGSRFADVFRRKSCVG